MAAAKDEGAKGDGASKEQLAPAYHLAWDARARRNLDDVPDPYHDGVEDDILGLANDPRPHRAIKIEPKKAKRYRLESHPYRTLYEIDDKAKIVTILDVGHRSHIYKRQR